MAGAGGGYNPYDSVASGGGGDQLFPFDSPEPWLHGYFQRMPAYSGYSSFRPHNYKHVLAQMQTAGRWGIPSTMPVSHQWYHQYRQRAGMHPSWDTRLTSNDGGTGYRNYAAAPAPQQQLMQTSAQPQQAQPMEQALGRGYPGTPIPSISTPTYERSAATYRSIPTFSQQYGEQFEALKGRLEQQTFRIQAMQQQLQQQQAARNTYRQAYDQFNAQSWAQPNHAQFGENSQRSLIQPPGAFVPPQSAMPVQSGMMNPPQGLRQSMPPYSSQPNFGQQYSNGRPAAGMQPAYGSQQTAPNGYYPPQPMVEPGMIIPQNSGYVMPQGIPRTSTMISNPGSGLGRQPVFPQQGYPQGWSGMQNYGNSNGYVPQASLPYGVNMSGNMAPPQMAPQPRYSAQPIPTGMSRQYPNQYGQ